MHNYAIRKFIRESNRIEGITDYPEDEQFELYQAFFGLEKLTIDDICNFVNRVAKAELRIRPGMDVCVGSHIAQAGGPDIKDSLQNLIDDINSIMVDRNGIQSRREVKLAMGRWEHGFNKMAVDDDSQAEMAELEEKSGPFYIHNKFMFLHPFMDGNGRAGRAIWGRQMLRYYNYDFKLGFLQKFYYQTLQDADTRLG